MQNKLLNVVSTLKKKTYVDKNVLDRFTHRIKSNPLLIKHENLADHLCSFFVPVNLKTNSIYLVHHKKANHWIPPGGHLEKDETPEKTVKREFYEELNYKLSEEKISLFDVSIININQPKQVCKIHYDFWCLVFIDRIDFIFSKDEFYDASWVTIEKAIKMVIRPNYNSIIKKLINLHKI